MNCGQCSLNQEGKEMFSSLVFWVGPDKLPNLVWNSTKEKHVAGVWRLMVCPIDKFRRFSIISHFKRTSCCLFCRSRFKHPFFKFCMSSISKNLLVDFSNLPRCSRIIHHSEHQVCINLVALSLWGNAV